MPSTFSTGYRPGSVYKTHQTTAQTMVWSSGTHAEFQDGSDARFRDGSQLIMRAGAGVNQGVTVLTSNNLNTTCIANHGVYILRPDANQVYKLGRPTSGCCLKIVISGGVSTKCDIAIQASSNKADVLFSSSGQLLLASTQMIKTGLSRWVELIGMGASTWLIASWGPYTSQTCWSITTSTSIVKPS